jgi:hypothetical protein
VNRLHQISTLRAGPGTVSLVLHEDLRVLLARLDRIAAAIDVGCDRIDAGPEGTATPAVRDAMVETCWEAVRLGHLLTRDVAYDDLWGGLEPLVGIWRRIDAQAARVRLVDLRAVPASSLARTVADGLAALRAAVAELDDAQLQAVARPRDRVASRRAEAAIDGLEASADRAFVAALLDDRHGRLDSALAVLTSVAARAARERATASARRS